MACFLVSAAEAVVVTAVEKIEEKKEQSAPEKEEAAVAKIPLSRKLKWLTYMLWGGSFRLMFEHVWHGEVVPFFPFLTAVKDGEASEMLHEMATAGVCMALLVTAAWGIMVGVVSMFEKKSKTADKSTKLAGGLA